MKDIKKNWTSINDNSLGRINRKVVRKNRLVNLKAQNRNYLKLKKKNGKMYSTWIGCGTTSSSQAYKQIGMPRGRWVGYRKLKK